MICIQLQTHTPHFKYTNNLINSFIELTNIIELNIPIYIFFDTIEVLKEYKKRYIYTYDNIHYKSIVDVIDNIKLDINEKFEDLFKNVINFKWGAGGHRNYVAVKRVYSILSLEKLNYTHVWCLDSESLILKYTDLHEIIKHNINKPLLTVGKNNNGVKYPNIINNLLKLKYDDYKNISVRMNDFWFIHTKHFKNMIQMLFNIHKRPISYFINGSEQSVYEYYLYSLYLDNKNSIELIEINGDLHNNILFKNIINNSNINIDTFTKMLNETYCNKILSYRGDYYNECIKTIRGKELLNKLNIKIAVSNYQGL